MGQIVTIRLRNAVQFCEWCMVVVEYYVVAAVQALRVLFTR